MHSVELFSKKFVVYLLKKKKKKKKNTEVFQIKSWKIPPEKSNKIRTLQVVYSIRLDSRRRDVILQMIPTNRSCNNDIANTLMWKRR